MLEAMLAGLGIIFSLKGFGLLLMGVLVGLFCAAIPGLGGITPLVILLPFIIKLDPNVALLVFIGVGAAIHTSDTIPAVLFSVPGTSGAMATTIDGYQMARKGQGARALGAAYSASLIGGVIGALFLLATIPVVRPLVLLFGSPEVFMLALLGLSMISMFTGGVPLMGMALALLGVLLSQIGMDPQTGIYRWTFGARYLIEGFPLLPAILGIFGFAEMADLAIKGTGIATKMEKIGKGLFEGVKDTLRNWFLLLRSSAIGVWWGILPGVGGGSAVWVAYGHAAQTCKNPENFGKGDVRGVIAPESANNACLGGDLLPTIAFGVPGNVAMVLYLAVFTMLGIIPGPDMFTKHLDLVFALGWGIAVGNVMGALICMALSTQIIKIIQLPIYILTPMIMVFIFIGSIMTTANMGDLYTLVLFGILGYVLKKFNWPRPPLVLGLVLGPLVGKYLFISISAYGLAWLIRPWVIVIGLIMIASIVFSTLGKRTSRGEEEE